MWKQIGQRVEERDLPTTEQARFGGGGMAEEGPG